MASSDKGSERRFLTGAASGGLLGASRIAGSSVSCPAPYSFPPGGLSSVPQWLQRGTMRNGGSGCASFMKNTLENWLSSHHYRFPDPSLQIPPFSSSLRVFPTVSTLQDHHAVTGTNTGHCGSSPPLLPCPPTRKCQCPPTNPQRHDPISFSIVTTPSPLEPQEREAPKLVLQGAPASNQYSQQRGSR